MLCDRFQQPRYQASLFLVESILLQKYVRGESSSLLFDTISFVSHFSHKDYRIMNITLDQNGLTVTSINLGQEWRFRVQTLFHINSCVCTWLVHNHKPRAPYMDMHHDSTDLVGVGSACYLNGTYTHLAMAEGVSK